MSATNEIPRGVQAIVDSHVAPVGSFSVRRALPARDRRSVGPWVFLDHFGPYRAKPGADGVGAHPHAGIETVTYLLSGRNEHRDSAGHHGVVDAGGVQWMTAGRGVVHSEHAFGKPGEPVVQHGIQLWTSLPRALKMIEPRYQRIEAADIARIERDGARVRIIAGDFEGTRGPAQTRMPLMLAHLSLAPGARYEAIVRADFEVAAYLISGEGKFATKGARAGQLVSWSDGGGKVVIENGASEALEVLILAGTPAEGPLVFHGPFVMNSVEQVRAAEIAFRTGRMGTLEEA